jgi:hypothetical protein
LTSNIISNEKIKCFFTDCLALLLGFGAAMGYYLMEKSASSKRSTQIQSVNLQHVYQLHEFKVVAGLNEKGNHEEFFYVKIEQALPIRLQLAMMANALSRHCFSYLPIEVQGIQEYDGKKVAVINLKEFEGFKTTESRVWSFMGSMDFSREVPAALQPV